MFRTRTLVGSLLLVLAFGWLGVGCGGSDDSGSPLDPAAASDDTSSAPGEASADATAATDGDAASRSDGGSGADAPQLAQGSWEGTLHFEISGDVDVSKDLVGTGITQGGYSLLTFTADDGSASSQIGFNAGADEEAAVFVSSQDFTGGGAVGDGKECSISMSQNDESAAKGNFSCKGAKGVSASSLDDFTVDIEGTFTMTRP